MNDSSQAITGMLGLWMLLQLAVLLALLLGGLYALYCLSRAASGLDRLAGAVEEWVARQAAPNAPPLPGQNPLPGAPSSLVRSSPLPPVPGQNPAPPPASPPTAPPASPMTPPLRPMEVPVATPPMAPPLTTPAPFIEEAFGEARGEALGEARGEAREGKSEF